MRPHHGPRPSWMEQWPAGALGLGAECGPGTQEAGGLELGSSRSSIPPGSSEGVRGPRSTVEEEAAQVRAVADPGMGRGVMQAGRRCLVSGGDGRP